MSNPSLQKQAPRSLRVVIFLLSVLLTFLLIWLLTFLLEDINELRGPDYARIESQYVNASLQQQTDAISGELAKIGQQSERQQEIRQNAQQSMQNARETIDKMVDLHRLSLEKGVSPSPEQQAALAQSQQRFLQAQERVQQADAESARLAAQRFDRQQELEALRKQLEEQRRPAREAFQRAQRRHSIAVASLKLALIVPLFLLSGWLVQRLRRSPYRPIFAAALVATVWQIAVVMHQHFPSEFFKYIAIIAAIALTLAFLTRLLRIAVQPRLEDLIKCYREGYNQHRCPVCAYPIHRGPLRHATWGRKGPLAAKAETPGNGSGDDAPYSCPVCGTRLFEPCDQCGRTRHSLLPYCEACGGEHPLPGTEPPGVSQPIPTSKEHDA
jgi:hypothetical protein